MDERNYPALSVQPAKTPKSPSNRDRGMVQTLNFSNGCTPTTQRADPATAVPEYTLICSKN